MNAVSYKTVSANAKTVTKEWVVVNAEDMVLGRLSTQVAMMLRGKNKTNFTPHVDCGDNVIVLNASKIKLTGKKMTDKEYIHYTGYTGGQRFGTPKEWMAKNPSRIIETAVRGMLPKNKLGAALFRNLYVYAGMEHPHVGQKPKEVKISK